MPVSRLCGARAVAFLLGSPSYTMTLSARYVAMMKSCSTIKAVFLLCMMNRLMTCTVGIVVFTTNRDEHLAALFMTLQSSSDGIAAFHTNSQPCLREALRSNTVVLGWALKTKAITYKVCSSDLFKAFSSTLHHFANACLPTVATRVPCNTLAATTHHSRSR